MSYPTDWKIADELSDEIIDTSNRALAKMRASVGFEPLQLLAGHLLALKALQQTMPEQRPDLLNALFDLVDACLSEMIRERSLG